MYFYINLHAVSGICFLYLRSIPEYQKLGGGRGEEAGFHRGTKWHEGSSG